MPKVLYSPPSPYSAKVRMAAAYARIPLEAEVVDTNAQPAELVDNNPLGKIPMLVTDDGRRSTTAGPSRSISTAFRAARCSRAIRPSG